MRVPLPSVPGRLVDVEVAESARRGTPLALLVAVPRGEDTAAVEVNGVRATGKAGDVQTLPREGNRPKWLVGVGDGEPGRYRQAAAALIRAVNAYIAEETDAGAKPSRAVQVEFPDDAGADEYGAFAGGAVLGGYQYKVSSSQGGKPGARTVRLLARCAVPAYADAVGRATVLAAATAFARDLANTPSNVKDPAWLASTAQKAVAGLDDVTATVRDERWLAREGFGGVLAVGGGSTRPPRLVQLDHAPKRAKAHLLFVGKGITFDTGGLSIKPAENMHVMRTDMAGGAAVIAATRAIAQLGLPVRVTALVPAAENHVSGSSYRPGDVVRHYGGKTTEVGNTDAEGRMVLADGLAYGIEQFEPDAVIDVATLTGAMKVSLGLRTGGLFASDDALAERVLHAGGRAGEAWWRMPLLEDVEERVAGEIGDVKQMPGGPGGIAAALFLREFTRGMPWAHLDIAGPARADKTYTDVVPGATGFAARTLVELAASYR